MNPVKSQRVFFLILLLFALPCLAQQRITLEQCRLMALEHNQQLKIAAENRETATAARKAAFSKFLPDFGFTGGYSHATKELGLLSENKFLPVVPYSAITPEGHLDATKLGPDDIVINPVTHQPVLDKNGNPLFQKYAYIPKESFNIDLRNIFSLNFGMTQPLFTGGKILNLYRSAKIMERMAWSAQALETGELLYKVEECYWRLTSVEEKVKLAREYRKLIDKLVSDLENYRQEGMIINNDLLKAQVRQTEAELAQLKADNGLILSRMALCQVIGLPLDSLILPADSVTPKSITADPAGLTRNALANRPELSMLRDNISLSQAGVNIMKSRFLPDVGLTAGYGWTNPSPYNGFIREFEGDLNVGIVCRIPLWHWGERVHTLEAAKHVMKSNELKLQETEEKVTLQVRQAQSVVSENVAKTRLTERSLFQSMENLRVVNDRFSEGMLKTTDVLEAQSLWQKARSENIDARGDLQVSQVYLKKVSGELSEEKK